MARISLPSLCVETERLPIDYREYLQHWQYQRTDEELRAACYFLAFGLESLDGLRDADIKH